MKILVIIFLTLLLSACGKSNKAKLNFKINLGALATAYSGGIYINAINSASGSNSILTADENGVVDIPYGTYKFLVVAFAGPGMKSGSIVCGNTPEVALSTADTTISVNVNATNCSDQSYINFINALLNTNVALWDTATFDNSNWGP